jgi:hypothetical protein
MPVQDWQELGPNNVIEGIDAAEGSMTPPNINNLFRAMAAAIKVFYNKTYRKDETVKIIVNTDPTPGGMADGDILIKYIP